MIIIANCHNSNVELLTSASANYGNVWWYTSVKRGNYIILVSNEGIISY